MYWYVDKVRRSTFGNLFYERNDYDVRSWFIDFGTKKVVVDISNTFYLIFR